MITIPLIGTEIPIYGLFCYIGIIASVLAGLWFAHLRKFPKVELVYSGAFAMVGGFLGSKLLFLVVSMGQIIALFQSPHFGVDYGTMDIIAALIQGGFVFYGGIIGGFLGILIYVKSFKLNIWEYLNIYATALPLGHALGRVGCFFGGCCYGIPVSWGYVYEETIGATPIGIPLLPIQLIEAECLLLLFAVQMILYFAKPNTLKLTSYFYLIAYPVMRFILEFFRGDVERGKFLLSTSQWVSLAVLIATVTILIVKGVRAAKKKNLSEGTSSNKQHIAAS